MKVLTLSALIAVALLVSPMFVPLVNALPQQSGVQILGVTVNGNVGTATISVDGVISTVSGTITTNSSGDPTVSTAFGYASWPQYIGTPPYGGVFGIHNPPEIYVYLNPNTALNAGGTGALTGILAIVVAVTSGLTAGVAAAAIGLLVLDYSTVYGADHSPDGSMSMWIPADWVNLIVLFEGSHDLYIATPNYWWLCLPGLAIRSNR